MHNKYILVEIGPTFFDNIVVLDNTTNIGHHAYSIYHVALYHAEMIRRRDRTEKPCRK